MKTLFLTSVLWFCILGASTSREGQVVRVISFLNEGSVPPAPALYGCTRALQDRIFDKAETKKCVEHLLASKLFEEATFSVKDFGSSGVELVFHLKSRPLFVRSIRFELPESERSDLETWLTNVSGGLRVGAIYESNAQARTFYGIQNFFRARGQSALFSSTLKLDYRAGDAQIVYQFVLGPKGPEEVVLTSLASCAHPIKYLDLTGIEDTVPFPLVDQVLRVRAFSCFDKSLLERDEKRLLASGFVKAAHFSMKQDGEGWEVSLAAGGDQLVVQSVYVVCIGEDLNVPNSQVAALPLQMGREYRNSLAEKSVDMLEKALSGSGRKLSVIPRANLVGKGLLHVEFDVLVAPDDQLFINEELAARD